MIETYEEALEKLDQEEAERNALFLKSWKIAINRIGPSLFSVTSPSVDEATDRNQLRPDPEAIEQYITENHGHHYFIFLVVSFFSYSLIESLFAEAGIGFPRVVDFQFLDETERMIIYSLIEHYEDW